MKNKKELIEENKMKRKAEGACSTSYPSGNQVDGLPLVAMKKKEQAAPHAGALDHDKHVFEGDCFKKCACELHNKFKLCTEASHKDSQISK